MNPFRPIDIVVQGWCGDAVAVVAVDGEIDADSCAALASAVAQATRTYRAVIIDLTHVRLLSAAGLHCLDCVGQVPDERQGVVHLVCAESSPVRSVATPLLRGPRCRCALSPARYFAAWRRMSRSVASRPHPAPSRRPSWAV